MINPSEETLRANETKGLVIETSVEQLQSAEKWKAEINVVIVGSALNAEEEQVKRDYESLGRLKEVKEAVYNQFRRELSPRFVFLYGPSVLFIQSIVNYYFEFTGYKPIKAVLSANEILQLPKHQNYVFLRSVPRPGDLAVLEAHSHVTVLHFKHSRTELADQEAYFDEEAQLFPQLQKKQYFFSFSGQQQIYSAVEEISQKLLPEIIYANVATEEQRKTVS